MDFKKCDFCLKDFVLARDPVKGFNEMIYNDTDGYTLNQSNKLNRFVVTKKSFFSDKEKTIDICDKCLIKLFGNIR